MKWKVFFIHYTTLPANIILICIIYLHINHAKCHASWWTVMLFECICVCVCECVCVCVCVRESSSHKTQALMTRMKVALPWQSGVHDSHLPPTLCRSINWNLTNKYEDKQYKVIALAYWDYKHLWACLPQSFTKTVSQAKLRPKLDNLKQSV